MTYFTAAATARRLTRYAHALLIHTAASGPSRQSRLMTGLRVYLWEAQNGRCFDCRVKIEDPTAVGFELCHIIGLCEGRGYMPGNIALGCRACNSEHNGYGAFIPFGEIERLGMVVVSEWPSAAELIAGGNAYKSDRAATGQDDTNWRRDRRDYDAV